MENAKTDLDHKQIEAFLRTPALKMDVMRVYLAGSMSKSEFKVLFSKHSEAAKQFGICVDSFDQAWGCCKQSSVISSMIELKE